MAKISFEEYKQDYFKKKQTGVTSGNSASMKNNSGKISFDDYKTNYNKGKLTEKTNSWLRDSVSYFDIGDDEYTPEYFNTRKQTATKLATEADSILEGYKSSFGVDSDEYKGFSEYYTMLKQGLDDSVSYYGQNPYIVKYKDINVEDIDGKIEELNASVSELASGDTSGYERIQKEIESLNAMKKYLRSLDYDKDGKINIKDVTKAQLDKEDKVVKFVRENSIPDSADIIHSDEYKIGESYIIGLEGSPYGFSKFEGIKYLEEKEKDNLKYLLGKKLKEKGYNTTRAGLLGADEFLTEAESSGEFDELSDAYLDALKETLNKREAEDIYSKIEDKPALEVAEMLRLGLGSNPEGIYRSLAFGKDNTAKTTRDYLTDMINEDLSDDGPKLPDWLGGRSLGQMAGSLAQSYGQMLPSMALSAIPGAGPVLSSVSFGMSAGGNAKVELMREGYDETTATIYGMLVGSAEAGLEKLMGSIPGLSSSGAKVVTKGIKNAFLKAAANYGIDVVGEALEESAQEVLEPAFRWLSGIDPEEIEKVDWSEVAYAGLQGAIMAGGTNTVTETSSLIRDISTNFENPTVENYKALDELIRKGLEGDIKSDFYKESKRLNGMIQKSYDKAIAEGKSAEVAAVESIRRLTRNDVARVLTAQEKTMRKAMKAEVKAQKAEAKAKVKAETSVKGAESSPVDTAEVKAVLPKAVSEVKTEGSVADTSKQVPFEITSDNAARTKLHKNGIAAQIKSSNETVGVVGVEYSDGQGAGNVTYRTSEGKVIKGSDLEFDTDYMGYILKTAAESLPTDSANALIKTADVYREYAGSSASSDKLISSFIDLREAAVRGMTFEQASNDIRLSGDISQLGEAAARIAINDGLTVYVQEQAKAEKAKTDKKAEYKKAVPVKGAVRIADDVKVTSSMKANMPILKRIARSGNVAVVIEKFSGAESASKGYYDGVLHLNAEKLSEGGFSYTGIHESVHHVAKVNPEGYKSMEKFIENYYKEKGVDIEAEIKATQDLYKKRGVELTPEQAMEEIVCNTLSDIATDADALTAFMGLDSKAQNKFIEVLKAIAQKLKEWANKCLGNTEYHSVVLKDADALLSLAKRFRAELENAGQKNNTAENSGGKTTKYDFDENFGQQLSDWLEGKGKKYGSFNGEYFSLGTTPNILIKHGAPSLDFIVSEDVVAKVTGMKDDEAHVIAIEELAKLPSQMNDPILLFKGSVPNSFVALTEIKNKSGHDVVAIVHINKWNGRARVNRIVSAYSKTNQYGYNRIVAYVTKQISEGNLIDGNIKKAVSWFTSKGLQLPKLVQTTLTTNNSISNNSKDVNSKSFASVDEEYLSAVESGDVETAQRLVDEATVVAMKDTKVRNEKGKITKVYGGLYNKSVADANSLIKVYHGTESEDFYEFDKQRRGQTDSSMYGRGYYFAFDTDYASDFGKNIREFYLNIKNPFFIDINAPSKVIAEFLESKGIEVNISDRNKQSHYFAKMFGSQKFTDTLIDLGYDGVIARTDEGEFFEAVAFHRNQMKLADAVTYDNDGNVIPISERFNLEKKDIRYSFGEEELDFGSYVSEGSEASENLKESGRAVGGLFEATRGAKLEEAEINRVLNKHLKNFKVTAELESHRARVAQIVELAERQDYVDGGAVVGEIATVMKDAVMKSDYIVDNHKEEREDIISRMRGVGKIYLTADQVASLEANDYSLNWFKKKMFGKVTVVSEQKFTKGSTESLNGLWHSLSEAYPQHFSADTLSDDMPLKMMKVLNGLKPDVVGADEYFMMSNDEVAIELANNVISDIVDAKYKKLSDEKLKARVKALKSKQSDNMKKWLTKKDAAEKYDKIEKLAAGFYKKLTKPNKNESVPEELREPMLELLNSLDFTKGKVDNRSTTRIKDAEGNWVTVPNENKGQPIKHDQIWQVKMKELAVALMGYGGLTQNPETKDITLKNDAVRGFEIDAKLIADMNELAKGSGAKNLYKMSDEEIINLYSVLYRLRNEISQINKLNANKFKAQVQELGQATVSELKAKGENKLLKSKANKLLFYSTADALTYFSQFGEAGMSVYDELREGYDKYILNINKVRLFTKDNLDEKKIKEWSKESEDFTLKSGDKVTLTVPQLMTLYLLDKRKQARGHLYDNPDSRGQITVEDSKGNKETVIVENDDIILMTAKLKPEQIKCAEKLQSFLENEVAEWGNEITMRRYLYRAFTTKDYFPIKVDGVSVDTTDATASLASFYAVANPGFSKRTQEGAHKPLIIGDVFDVFAEHCGNMAMFNGMSEALSDAMRWYNFRMGNSEVKRAIRDNLSQDALNWFERFIQDLNGRGQKASDFDKTVKKMVGVTKSALIWGNMKVVAQQPTAYYRALNVINPKHLADPRVFKKGGVEKAMKHCPTAMYKSWGFYTTDVGRSARNLILNTGTVYDKAKDVGFFLAGKADELTWGRLWNACELQVLDTTELTRSSEGFNEAVAELLRKVIDETQVVDTPFHRSQVRRDTSAMAQVYSAFMDEPIKAYNMWMRALQSGDGKKILRTAVAFTTTVVFGQALVKALWDLFIRYNPEDDEDGERKFGDFLRLYGKSVFDEMNLLNLHPLLTKLSEAGEALLHKAFPDNPLFDEMSYGSSSLDTMAFNDLTNSFGRIISWLRGVDTNRTWYGFAYDISKVIGDFSGIGVNRVLQDVVGFVNNFLPSDKKVTKTEYSNTAVSKFAVNSLLNGNKRDYELWYEELLSRNRGDREKADKQIASALSKSNDERVRAAYDARERGDVEAIRSTHQVLVNAGFSDNIIIKGTASYKSQYESYVKKVAKAQIEGDSKVEDEALSWIKEQGVFNNVYEEDIEAAKEKLIADGEAYEDEEMFDNWTMVNALKNSGAEDFAEMLEDRLADCETEEQKAKVKSSVKSAVTSEYKRSYFTAYEQGDSAELKRIEDVLISTGLYGSNSTELWKATKEWIRSGIKSGYENAYSIGDPELMKHYERMLNNSNVYSSDTDLKKKLEEWRNGQK